MGELDTLSFEAYSLYSQGMTYREIAYALGIKKERVKYQVVKHARKTSSPYPLLSRKYNGDYLHALFMNGMSVRDISQLMGLHRDKVYYRIKRYCEDKNLANPFIDRRAEFAFRLRKEKRWSYEKVAKVAGFTDRSNCFRAVKRHKERFGE